jgi:hypothetical protein
VAYRFSSFSSYLLLFLIISRFKKAKIVSVWDMTQCSIGRLSKAQLQMLQQTMHVVGAHYPERNEKLFIVNAPWWVFATQNM